MAPLLEVENLKVHFKTDDGVVKAVDGISYSIDAGQTLGIVGESGSGKSVSSMTVMGLTRARNAEITGSIRFDGQELLTASDEELRQVRGGPISMIFQDPLSSLHPMYKIGSQLVEAVRTHQDVSKAQARDRAIEMLGLVGIPEPRRQVDAYPHEFSGGMRQRVMIAMALSNDPRLLIADEPTTALDVTVQAQILALLEKLKRELDTAIVLITHDLGVVAEVTDDIAVMYAGRIVEKAPTARSSPRPSTPTRGACCARSPGSTRRAARSSSRSPAARRRSSIRPGAARSTRAAPTCARTTGRSTRPSSPSRGSLITRSPACSRRRSAIASGRSSPRARIPRRPRRPPATRSVPDGRRRSPRRGS